MGVKRHGRFDRLGILMIRVECDTCAVSRLKYQRRLRHTEDGNDNSYNIELGKSVSKDPSRDCDRCHFFEDTGDRQRDDSSSLNDAGMSAWSRFAEHSLIFTGNHRERKRSRKEDNQDGLDGSPSIKVATVEHHKPAFQS